MRRQPPPKRPGRATGARRFSGELLDVRSAATEFFGANSEKTLRARIARREVPFKRLGGRIVLLRSELTKFFAALDGVTVEQALARANRTDE